MPILKIENVGQHGIITDVLPHQLPPNAWTDGKNIRFNDIKAVKFTGHQTYHTPPSNWDGGATNQIYYLLPVSEPTDYYWIYCGLKDVRATSNSDTSTSKEITNSGANYTATDVTVNWTGCIIGGVPVINNGVDTPQMWNPVDYSVNTLEDLTGFAAAATKCGALRAYKNYLVALDVTKGGTRYPSLVKWSDSSALGTVPASWDETDETTDAGETELAGTRTDLNTGTALDCMTMRDANIIYRDDSIWSMNFIGGPFVFEFRKIYSAQGMLTRKCMAEFGGKHFVVGQADVFVHDGANFTSVIDTKNKDFLFNDMDPTYYDRTFVFANYAGAEMWICYVENSSGATWPNKALVWNWEHQTWGVRDLPSNTAYIEGGVVDTQDTTDIWTSYDSGTGTHDGSGNAAILSDSTASWSTDEHVGKWLYNTTDGSNGLITANTSTTITATLAGGTDNDWDASDAYGISDVWSTWTTEWGSLGFTPQKSAPALASVVISKGDVTNQFAGTSFTSNICRTDIPLGEQDNFVRVKAVYPRLRGSTVNINIGVQQAPEGTIKWNGFKSFTPGTDQKMDVRLTGTHLAIKVQSDGDDSWEMSGIDIEFEPIYRR
jgi:hypothetical protein